MRCCTSLLVALLALVFVATALPSSCANIAMSTSSFPSPVWKIVYIGADYQTVFMLDLANNIYRSDDEGNTWTEQLAGSNIYDLFSSADEQNLMVFNWPSPSTGTTVYHVSTDQGATYSDLVAPFTMINAMPHPTDSSTVAVFGQNRACGAAPGTYANMTCQQNLYLSTDWGQTWTMVADRVLLWYWAGYSLPSAAPDTILSLRASGTGDMRRLSTSQLYCERSNEDFTSPVIIATSCGGLLPYKDVTFIATYASGTNKLSMWTSRDAGATLMKTSFPHSANISEYNYHILDVNQNAISIHVDHSSSWTFDWGNVYVSDSLESQFTLSLPYNSRLYNSVDFRAVAGINGTYWANQWTVANPAVGPAVGSVMQSRMSYDLGANWYPIPAPMGTMCTTSTHTPCHLQLNGPSTSWFGSFYSHRGAPGLITATGVVGANVAIGDTSATATYFSRDAGATWTYALPGYHTYEYGNAAGIVTAALLNGVVNSFQWTLDQGATWSDCALSQPFDITNIINEPYGHSTAFLIYGTRNSGSTIVSIDFADALPNECQGIDTAGSATSDFELWSPYDPFSDQKNCLLGQIQTIVRRKQSSICYVTDMTVHTSTTAVCPCTPEDYICTACFMRACELYGDCESPKTANLSCVLDTDSCPSYDPDTAKPSPCKGNWHDFEGHQLVPGSMCDVKNKKSYYPGVDRSCKTDAIIDPNHKSGHGAVFAIVSIVLLCLCCAALGGAAMYLYRSNPAFRDAIEERFPQLKSYAPVSVDDGLTNEDAKSLMDDYNERD